MTAPDPAPAPAEAPESPPGATEAGPEEVEGTDEDGQQDQDEADDKTSRNREAQKWRQQLRAEQAERIEERESWAAKHEGLIARLEVLQRGEVERMAAAVMADPGDLFRDGAQLADLLDHDGNVDAARVKAAANAAVAAHPHWSKREAIPKMRRGALASGASGMDSPTRASWSAVLRSD